MKQLSFYPINHCTFLFFFFFEKSLDPRFHDHFPGSSLLTLLNHKFNYSLFASERWKSLVLVGAKGGEWATPSIRNSPVRLLTRRSEGAKRWFIAHAPRWILDIRGGGRARVRGVGRPSFVFQLPNPPGQSRWRRRWCLLARAVVVVVAVVAVSSLTR